MIPVLSDLPPLVQLPSDEAHAQYAALRPQRFAQSPNGLLGLLHYEDVQAVLCDPDLKPTGLELLDLAGVTEGPLRAMFERLVFNLEGEAHTRLRRLISSTFTPRAMERMRASIRAHVHALLDGVVEQGEADLTGDLAKPLAITTLCDLLGVPHEDIPRFQHWAAGMGQAFGVLTPQAIPVVEEAAVGMSEYAEVLIARRRAEPREDLVSALVDSDLTVDELVATVANLLFAGYDTTYRQITLGLRCLAQHPEAWQQLAKDAELAGPVVEEVLRLEPIAHSTVRLVVRDTVVNGIELAAGGLVEPMIGAANRDPQQYAEPDRLDPHRDGPRPLSFGQGIHHCLGAALARLELGEALAGVAARLDGWQVQTDPPNWYPTSEPFRGLATLRASR
jgi:cytochrome P450